jgi:hypothetical protein
MSKKLEKSAELMDWHWLLRQVRPKSTFKVIVPETLEFTFSFPTHPVKPDHLEAACMP